MPTYTELTDALDQAWRSHDYVFALSCIRDLLSRYHGSNGQLHLFMSLVRGPVYSNLAAALEADDVLKAMDRVARRISTKGNPAWAGESPEKLAEERQQTLATMRWLRRTVEQAEIIELSALTLAAGRERLTKVKGRLNWMEKAGTLHFLGSVVQAGPGPDPQFLPMGTMVRGVPLIRKDIANEGYMNDAQLSFFQQFEARYRAGEHVEIESQWGYAATLLSNLEEEHEGDPEALRDVYERFEREWPNSPASPQPSVYEVADDLFKIGDWQGGFDLLSPKLTVDLYLTLAPFVVDTRMQVATVENWTTQGRKATAPFRGRKAEVDATLQDLLDAAHDDLGRSIVVDLWHRLIVDRVSGASGPDVAHEFGGFIAQEKIDDYLACHDRESSRSLARLREEIGLPPEPTEPSAQVLEDSPDEINWPAPYCDTYWFEQILQARIQSLYRDAENIVRRGAGIPSVGEGWVSEVLLLRSVREAFPERKGDC